MALTVYWKLQKETIPGRIILDTEGQRISKSPGSYRIRGGQWLECKQLDYDKLCVMADEHSDRDGLFHFLEPDMVVIDRGDDFYECVPKGYSKATAIEWTLRHYGIDFEDAYVFGDSSNDLSMFEYAKHAVLMGRHDAVLEPYATFVTKTVEEDGIDMQ